MLYDIAIIGSGPGGYVAAIRAAQLKKNVVVIEKSELGGICLNWGCIPTKALLRSSEVNSLIKRSHNFGINAKSNISFKYMIDRSRKVSKKLSNGISYLFKKNKVNLIKGHAYIEDNNTIAIKGNNSEKKINAKNIIIATGARPKMLPFVKNSTFKIWNYVDAMLPDSLPSNLGIIGSGAIGIEFASFYNDLGVKVKVFENQDRIAPNEDYDISNTLEKCLTSRGISFYKSSNVIDIKKGKSFILSSETNSKTELHHFEKVLSAVGVEANIDDIGLENTKIKIKNNQIITYNYGKTDEDNIFAIGDVAGIPWLAHKASHEGIETVEFIANHSKIIKKDSTNTVIPACIYSRPQVASIGITESIAKEKGIDINVGKFPLSANGKALSLSEEEGFIKTIFAKHTGEILGAHMIGSEVTELIGCFALAIRLEATEEDIINTIFPHPTLSESIHESVLNAFNRGIHI